MKITMYRNKGFTLIELLVVIAIIGVLASVVLASLNDARDRGSDAAVKASINNARAQAALYYDTNGTYTGVCTDSGGIQQFASSSDDANNAPSGNVDCYGDTTDWALEAQLAASTTKYYCVDSTGFAGELTGQPETYTTTIGDGDCG